MPDKGRIEALDALRGFAILGILIINIQVFSGYAFVSAEAQGQLPGSQYDPQLRWLSDWLASGRFYSLFSLLFGYSFVMLAQKIESGAAVTHLRRMAGLFLIGLAHAVLLWPWDILAFYAVVGLVLTLFLHGSARLLLFSSLGVFVASGVVRGFGFESAWQDGLGELSTRLLQDNVPVLAGDTYPEVVSANLDLAGHVVIDRVAELRPLRVLALFLVGAAAARVNLARAGSGHRGLLVAAAGLGLVGGLSLGFVELRIDPATAWRRLIVLAAESYAAPLIAVGYGACLLLWWRGTGRLGSAFRAGLAPVGRMALTNYLLHSAVCVPVFYGFGGDWFAEIALGPLLLLAAGLFMAQAIFSAVWLSGFRQGPLEWLWRWQIQGRRPPMRKRYA